MAATSAIVYALGIVGVIGFQLCLIAGAPLGHLTQGGRGSGPLPVKGRVFAGVSVLLLLFMGASVMSAAGMRPGWPEWTAWVALAIQTFSTIANWATPSRAERRIWGPITSVMLIAALIAVFGG